MSLQQSIKEPTHTRHTPALARLRARHLLALIAAACLLLGAIKGWRIYSRAEALRQDAAELSEAATRPELARIETLGPLLARTHANAQALRDEAAPLLPITHYLGWLPRYGTDLASAENLLDLAVDMAWAAEDGYIALMPALRPLPAGQPAGAALVQRLGGARPDLEHMRQTLARASAAWERLPLAGLSPALRAQLQLIAPLLPAARDGVDLALALPDLLGAHGRQVYLLVAQNPDELRPTGGLITAAGVVALEGGRIAEFDMSDSGAVNDFAKSAYPPAPEPLRRYMGFDVWGFQDANWSPDLPTASAAIADLYARGRGREVRDMVVIDPQGLQLLVGALGTLQVEGAAEPITAANLLPYLRNAVFFTSPQAAGAAAQPWWVQRKAFMAPLGRALLARLESDGANVSWPALLGALHQALDERHIQLVLRQPDVAAVLARRGWDGAVRAVDGDFLLLSSANLGYNKVSPLVHTTISYTVDLSQPAAPIAELSVRQRNGAAGAPACDQSSGYNAIVEAQRYEDLMAGCAWIYLRALAPEGSQLVSSLGNPTPGGWLLRGQPDDGGATAEPGDARTTAIDTFLVIPPGQTRRSFFRYRLPDNVLAHDAQGYHYQLTIQAQPGAPAAPTSVRVRLPRGAALVSASPAPAARDGQELVFQATLARDIDLDLRFAMP